MKPNCYATLLTTESYAVGVEVLAKCLYSHGSRYPLIVLCTDEVSDKSIASIEQLPNVSVKKIHKLLPSAKAVTNFVFERFADVFTKFEVWKLIEYEKMLILVVIPSNVGKKACKTHTPQVCLLDADMLVIKNMDEVFDLLTEGRELASTSACICNVMSNPRYPAHWIKENCAHTWKGRSQPLPSSAPRALNAGILLLRPSMETFRVMNDFLSTTTDLTKYQFPEQDWLNEYFPDWVELPYIYNALKTMSIFHANVWNMDDVKNIHYIMEKPWDFTPEEPEFGKSPYVEYKELNQMWWNVNRSPLHREE
ncbi:hypothetical protein SmJEL517_g04496 [Synchytrium microbalum]|uniref:Uncharacterized protein n=1 Tax=Synchytrium microbalum TaxID=1806994 RepID=A0A507BZQ9_9FUNG|nr:uncharacterized protein SmJEL517_g04496 [Synchytrium microbalum]TPX32349.1 hypothetical protein SmJEL517_g04496 [Synchytrium microbalum]